MAAPPPSASLQDTSPRLRRRLRVDWFESWHPVLDEALETLPEADNCPHELYRLLAQNPTSAEKRTALVTTRGVPVAVACLRRMGSRLWEPVTQWLVPGIVVPARPGYLMPALESLRSDVFVAWWRVEGPPPPSRMMRHLERTPVHRMRCSEDFEGYWREAKYFKTVQHKRNRCRDFALAVNSPGAARWVIENWDAKWHDPPGTVGSSIPDRILAVEYLEELGKHHTLQLFDGERPVAGTTNTVHGNDLVAGVSCRDPDYDWHGVGVRIIDLVFSFAAEQGFDTMDIGGGHAYKKHWAPQEGARWQFNICPSSLYRAKQVSKLKERLLRRAVRSVRRVHTEPD
ncbi:MAG: GNAT family N-acetyltransferase [Actinobacteria bacterium]|jgi:hypothetical protein|nr:GNAT family N-acetyltransferase [Actinomycetota bacterium]